MKSLTKSKKLDHTQHPKQLKDNLKPNEAVAHLDFSENYQFQV